MKLSDVCLEAMGTYLLSLSRLAIINNSVGFTDVGLIKIAKSCVHLKIICIHPLNNSVTNASYLQFALHCKELCELVLCLQTINDECLCAVARNCSHMVRIHVAHSPFVTDIGVCALVKNCKELEKLCLGAGITDQSLKAIAECGVSLRFLSLEKCTQISEEGVSTVVQRCGQKLRYVSTPKGLLTVECKDMLQREYPLLHINVVE